MIVLYLALETLKGAVVNMVSTCQLFIYLGAQDHLNSLLLKN